MDSDAVEQFAAEAVRFEAWACCGTDDGEGAAREALIRIVRLYESALYLPDPWSDTLSEEPEPDRVTADEAGAVAHHSARLPFDCYGAVFDAGIMPPEQPVVGSIADDISDIYRDVVSGLRAYQRGLRAQAVWEWGFGFRTHWGDHATGAIRALHSWLAENAVDRLHNDLTRRCS